ncbi:MAG TPA: M48 family metalloprotease [Bryobacteraceae bacterium]|nr:M48 family metalloprotease [Bryobacteraceae bacterium]
MTWIRFGLVVAMLGAGAALATRGTPDKDVSLNSLVELWSDALRDTDQIGMKLTRVSDADEMRIGSELAQAFANPEIEDAGGSRYLAGVAKPMLPHLRRRGMQYQFHLINSPEINAFALPGGQIFVTRGMLDFVESEAELAGVLGHEMSHVDLRHCIEHYQYEAKLKEAGMPAAGSVVEIASFGAARILAATGVGSRCARRAANSGIRLRPGGGGCTVRPHEGEAPRTVPSSGHDARR